MVFPYIGEFQPVKRRHQILSWMEFFWAIGVIVVASKNFTITLTSRAVVKERPALPTNIFILKNSVRMVGDTPELPLRVPVPRNRLLLPIMELFRASELVTSTFRGSLVVDATRNPQVFGGKRPAGYTHQSTIANVCGKHRSISRWIQGSNLSAFYFRIPFSATQNSWSSWT